MSDAGLLLHSRPRDLRCYAGLLALTSPKMALSRQGLGLVTRCSGCGLEGDFVAEGFELSDVVASFGCGVDVAVVVVGAEVVEL